MVEIVSTTPKVLDEETERQKRNREKKSDVSRNRVLQRLNGEMQQVSPTITEPHELVL